jgi:diketogulonate reductase-like aldo/keto reductase
MAMKYPHPPSKHMKYVNPLKNTPLRQVSRLCFGTGMLKREKSDINLLATAFKKHGINFWDTADCYRTQKIVGAALKKVGRENIMIMTKIDAASEEAARKLIKRALSEIGTKYIDVVLLHGVESHEDFKRRKPALKVLLEHKNKGTIKAVGFSTHSSPEAVLKAPKEIDLILASINEARLDRGTKEEMMAALKSQKQSHNSHENFRRREARESIQKTHGLPNKIQVHRCHKHRNEKHQRSKTKRRIRLQTLLIILRVN